MNIVVYAADNNYSQQLIVSLYSLLETNSKSDIYIYILDNGITNENKKKILLVSEIFGSSIAFVDISNIAELLPMKVEVNKLSLSTYARLFLTELLPTNVHKVLYIDCDTVIKGSLSEIFELNMNSFSVAGVEDCMYLSYKTGIGLSESDRYMNAGILCINLDYWRKKNMVTVFMDFIKSYNGKVPHLDQGVINGTLMDKYFLPLKYNVQSTIFSFWYYKDLLRFFSMQSYYSREDVLEAKKHPVIIHYTSFYLQRPWFSFSLHPYKDNYRKIAKKLFPNYKLINNNISFVQKAKCVLFKYAQPIYLLVR